MNTSKKDQDIAIDRVLIARQVFGLIARTCETPQISRYQSSQLTRLVDFMTLSDLDSMARLELMRTDANNFSPKDNSGWIELCLLTK